MLILLTLSCSSWRQQRSINLGLVRLLFFLLLILMMHGSSSTASSHWGSFQRSNCIKPGYRVYRGTLLNPTDPCESRDAIVERVYFPRPDRCVNTVTGEFYLRDSSCDPKWHNMRRYGCEGQKNMVYSSWLEHIDGDWRGWCEQTSAVVRGIYFARPNVCYWSWFHEWADFHVPNPCGCNVHDEFSSWEDEGFSRISNHELGERITASPKNVMDLMRLQEMWMQEARTLARAGGSSSFNNSCGCTSSDSAACPSPTACSECQNREDIPPYPVDTGTATTVEEVVQQFEVTPINHRRILPFLYNHAFHTFPVSGTTQTGVIDYYAYAFSISNDQQILRLAPASSDSTHSFQAIFVPTTPGDVVMASSGNLPIGTYATIDVAGHVEASVIITERLTGCTIIVGWDRVNKVLYIGHIKPDYEHEPIQSRASVFNYMRMNGGFEGVTLDRTRDILFFGGDDMYYSYHSERANMVGFITQNRVTLFFQVTTNNNEQDVIKGWTTTYCSHDGDCL